MEINSKFNKTFKTIIKKYKLSEINNAFIINESVLPGFFHTYKHLINESYNIFPVPKLLLNDMIRFCQSHSGKEKHYSYNDILTKYTSDWKYYKQFKENINLMLRQNKYGSIVLCPFSSIKELKKFFKKYHNAEIERSFDHTTSACIFSYDDNFNLCLLVNAFDTNEHRLNKQIQHELIHWMQVTLNSETEKTYGLFDNKPFCFLKEDKKWLENVLPNIQLNNKLTYLEQGVEFEPWIANCVEEFEKQKYELSSFIEIIKNKQKFKDELKLTSDTEKQELLLFAELCYLSFKYDKNDGRFYYLIEAIKEN